MSEFVIYKLGPFKTLGVSRYVRVHAPREGEPGAPALFMFDGQNVFHDAPSYSGGWQAHRTVARMAELGGPAPVIVGIDHGGTERLNELSPFRCKDSRGDLPELLAWIEEAVVPRVRREFGTSERPSHNVVAGSSMGGLAATYAFFTRPRLFGSAIAMSPSFWFARRAIFGWAAEQPIPRRGRLYLDAGGHEGRFNVVKDIHRLAEELIARGMDPDHVEVQVDPGGTHSEQAWRHRLPAALAFAFGWRHPALYAVP